MIRGEHALEDSTGRRVEILVSFGSRRCKTKKRKIGVREHMQTKPEKKVIAGSLTVCGGTGGRGGGMGRETHDIVRQRRGTQSYMWVRVLTPDQSNERRRVVSRFYCVRVGRQEERREVRRREPNDSSVR